MTTRTRLMRRTNIWLILIFALLLFLTSQVVVTNKILLRKVEIAEKQACYDRAAFLQTALKGKLREEDFYAVPMQCDNPEDFPAMAPRAVPAPPPQPSKNPGKLHPVPDGPFVGQQDKAKE